MSKSISECQAELQQAIQGFYWLVIASVCFTFLVLILYHLCLQRRLEGAPGLDAQYWFVSGTVKICIGVVILLFFRPTCPDECFCTQNFQSYFIYPTIAIVIGLLWYRKGFTKFRTAQAVTGHGDAASDNDAVFKSVPTVEMA